MQTINIIRKFKAFKNIVAGLWPLNQPADSQHLRHRHKQARRRTQVTAKCALVQAPEQFRVRARYNSWW